MKSPIERIDFDVNNQEHRKAFYMLMKGHCWPIHFHLRPGRDNLIGMISEDLIEYYQREEFEYEAAWE